MQKLPIGLSLLLATLFAVHMGCGASARHPGGSATERLAPASTTASSMPLYRLGFGDVLEIKFFNNREFNETVPVRPDGRIAIEKVGEIEVAGKTAAYVDSVVTAVYSQFVRNPEVTVIVREFGSNQVYVFGEVNNPGRFAIEQQMTLVQAVAGAGGPKDTAKLNSVLVIRRGAEGRPVASRVDLWKLAKQEEAANAAVQPLDVIYVPRTFIADVSSFMTKVYAAIIPPLDAYLSALLYSRQ
jgi:polysaccharide export outer membrane protein